MCDIIIYLSTNVLSAIMLVDVQKACVPVFSKERMIDENVRRFGNA